MYTCLALRIRPRNTQQRRCSAVRLYAKCEGFRSDSRLSGTASSVLPCRHHFPQSLYHSLLPEICEYKIAHLGSLASWGMRRAPGTHVYIASVVRRVTDTNSDNVQLTCKIFQLHIASPIPTLFKPTFKPTILHLRFLVQPTMSLNFSNPGRAIEAGVILMGVTEVLDVIPIDFLGCIGKDFIDMLQLSDEVKATSPAVNFHWVTEKGEPAKMTAKMTIQATVCLLSQFTVIQIQ
jgi:hypothetical protein